MNDEHDIDIDDDDAVLALENPAVLVTQAPVPVLATDEDLDQAFGEDEDIEDLSDDLDLPDDGDVDHLVGHAVAVASDDPRIAELAATVDKLTEAAVAREQGRVRRKVAAASGGAGVAGVIPIILQLTGALNVDPEIASAVVGGVAVLGAFIAGWVTPERQSAIVAEALKRG